MIDSQLQLDFFEIKNSNCAFLKESFELRNQLKALVSTLTIDKIIKSENASECPVDRNFVIIGNDYVYFKDEAFLEIQKLISQYYAKTAKLSLDKNVNNVHFDNLPLYKALKEFFQPKILMECRTSIRHLGLDPNRITKDLFNRIQELLITKAVRKDFKYKVSALQLTYSSFSNFTGQIVFNSFLQTKENYLTKILFRYNSKDSKILPSDLSKLKELVTIILTDDQGALKYELQTLYNAAFAKDKFLPYGLSAIVLQFVCNACILNKTTFFDINDYLLLTLGGRDYVRARLQKAQAEIAKFQMGLGSYIIEFLKEKNVLTYDNHKALTFGSNKRPNMVRFTKEVIFSLIKAESAVLPELTDYSINSLEENSTYLEDIVYVEDEADLKDDLLEIHPTNDEPYLLQHSTQEELIRPHYDFKTIFKPNTNLSENPSKFKLSIDSSVLIEMLYFFDTTINRNFEELTLAKIDQFLLMFDIEMKRQLYLDDPVSKTKTIELINFALNFNIIYDKTVYDNFIKDLPINIKQQYADLFSKIMNYKNLYIGCLKQCVVYSLFGFIQFKSFMDSRGRHYIQGYFLNPQTFPQIKAFVKFFNPCFKKQNNEEAEKDFSHLISGLCAVIQNPDIKKEISNYKYNDFAQDQSKLSKESVYANLKNDLISFISFDNFINSKPSANDIMEFILKFGKKQEQWVIYFSFLYRIIYPSPLINNIVGFDATSSGLQMIAILFRLLNLGILVNLTGSEANDVYKFAAGILQNHLKDLKKEIIEFSIKFNYTYKINSRLSTNNTNLIEAITWFMQFDSISCIGFTDVVLYLQRHLSSYFANTYLDKFHWIIPTKEKLLQEVAGNNYNIDKKFLTQLLVLRHAFHIFEVFDSLNITDPNSIITRIIFKKIIMTFPYNATYFGRRDDLIEDLILLLNLPRYRIVVLVDYISLYFDYFINNHLKEAKYLKEVSKILSNLKKPITIDTRFFSIEFLPYKTKTIYLKTRSPRIFGRKHSISIKEAEIDEVSGKIVVDSLGFKRRFGASFIHIMDSTIVHLFYERINIMNNLLKPHNLFVNVSTNHDQWLSTLLAILKPLIRDCYSELYEMNFITSIEKSLEPNEFALIKSFVQQDPNSFLDGKFENNNIVKI